MTLLEFIALFEAFRGPSWDGWRAVLARLSGDVRELFVIAGRGAGKSIVSALLACFYATREYRRAPGERIYVGIFAPDRKQAGVTLRYVAGLLKSVPSLSALIEAETRESIDLFNGVTIEVMTASTAAPRGRSYALAICEEAAFLGQDDSADPDVELLRALRPALARVPGSLLAVIGSPYARRGVLYEAWRDGETEDRLVVAADTATLNPTFRRREIDRAWETDPVAAAAEYGRDGRIEFRADVASYISELAVQAVVPRGVVELRPDRSLRAVGHFDAATGSGADSAAAAVAYVGATAKLAAVRRWTPPFDPAEAAREAAALFLGYGVRQVSVDAFAPGLVASLFREHGVDCVPARRDTSSTFVELLGRINSRRVQLLDDATLLRELSRLERRPGNSGRDIVGHPARGHDDLIAAAGFALVAATEQAESSGQGLLFVRGGDESYLARLRQQVADLQRGIGERAHRAVAAMTTAASAAVERAKRLRPEQRTPEQVAARKVEAALLRAQRQAERVQASLKAAEARDRALMERVEQQAREQARLRGQREILRDIDKYGVWFPRGRR